MSEIPRCQKIRKDVRRRICDDCELSQKCTINCLPGVGLRNGVMIVGEKATQFDKKAFEPFRGFDGNKLGYLLHQAGLVRERCFLTYAVKCDPPKNSAKLKKYAAACRSHLMEQIEWVKPKVIITLGTVALQAVIGEDLTADGYRGFPLKVKSQSGDFDTWVVPSYSVTQTMGDAGKDPIVVRDLKLAKQIAVEGYQPKPIECDVKVLTSVDEAKELVGKLWKAPSFSYDLETKNLDFLKSPILCSSFAFEKDRAYVLPIDHRFEYKGEFRTWTPKERAQIVWLLKKAMISPAKKTAQNGKFDNKFLRSYGVTVKNFDFDTMLAHHLVDESKPHDLLFIAQWYNLIHEKYDHALELQKKIHGKDDYSKFDPNTLYYYAGIDAAVTNDVRPLLEQELIDQKANWVFRNVSIPQTYVLTDMEFRGAKIDLVGMNKIIKETDDKISQLKVKIKDIMKVDDFNPNSTVQLKAFFNKHRVNTGKQTKGGNMSLDEEVLKNFTEHRRVGEVTKAVLEMRGLTKLKGTYLDGKTSGTAKKKTGLRHKLDENHFIHTDFLIHGTYTGRLSSKGPNLQNIPKDDGIRQLFIPDNAGDWLMSVDYKQLEVRVAAAISKDPILIREILEGVDMHSRNAATLLLGVKEELFVKVLADKKHPDHARYQEARRAAKAVTFGVLYGSTAHGVSTRNKLDLDLCENFISAFFKKYRVLRQWIKSQHEKVHRTRRVRTPTGRFTRFYDLDWATSKYCDDRTKMIRLGEAERISVNMPIQGCGSDVFQMGKIKVFKHLIKNKMKSRLVLSLHDGFVLTVTPDEKEALKDVVPKLMYTVMNPDTKFKIPLEVDVEFSKRWEGKDE